MRFLPLLAVFCIWSGFSHAQTIKIDGSSTVFPITEAAAEEFQNSKKGKIKVTVGISGTGGGFKKFCRGETDVQNASRPIQGPSPELKAKGERSEIENCTAQSVKFIELPVAFDAMAIVANPANDWLSEITIDELKKMWEPEAQGKIMSWDQVNPKWPKLPLKLFGAGSDSGTFDYFTEAVMGKSKKSRGDYGASEDDNSLVQGVTKDKGALGYIPYAYYDSNKAKLKLIGVIGGDKSPKKNVAVLPSEKTVLDGTYYPLSRPIFIYVSEKSLQKPEVAEFAKFYLAQAPKLVREVKYVPLPDAAYKIGQNHLDKKKVGSVFDGHSQVGIKIEELMKKEAKSDAPGAKKVK